MISIKRIGSAAIMALAFGSAVWGTPLAERQKVSDIDRLTILDSKSLTDGVNMLTLRDASGRVYRQRVVNGENPKPLPQSPVKSRRTSPGVIFYEGFEGYQSSFGLDWIPEGWTEINTEAHTPTAEGLSHNVNNSWFVYYSSEMFQEYTPDGDCEVFIHFPYQGNYGASDAPSDEWLVTPAIEIGENQTLQFYHQADASTVYPYDWGTGLFDFSIVVCNMKVMATTDDGQTWTQIWDYAEDELGDKDPSYLYNTTMGYFLIKVPLEQFEGQNVKFAFRYISAGGEYWTNSMWVDGVSVISGSEPPVDPDWNYLGVGSLADGWVVPALTESSGTYYNPTDYSFSVEISESVSRPGVYKLHSPYTSASFPFRYLNGNDEPYDLIIDASDPEFVLMEPQISGFEHNNPGSKALRYEAPYYISNSGQYFLDEGNSREDIISYGYNSTFDEEEGRITITYPVYGHMEGSTLDMGYSCSDTENFPCIITLPESAPVQEWESIGFGTFEDGFITPGYLGDPAENRWQVEFLAKSDEPGVYMMVNPYTSPASPFYELNYSTPQNTLIKIDAANPDAIYIVPQYTGFLGMDNGAYFSFYIGNYAGAQYSTGTSKDIIEEYFSEDRLDTMTDYVITIKEPLFGSNAADDFGYHWSDENGNAIIYPAKIYLPMAEQPEGGSNLVDKVSAYGDENVRYYNLQGAALKEAPESGLWIEVKNGKAAKRVAK